MKRKCSACEKPITIGDKYSRVGVTKLTMTKDDRKPDKFSKVTTAVFCPPCGNNIEEAIEMRRLEMKPKKPEKSQTKGNGKAEKNKPE